MDDSLTAFQRDILTITTGLTEPHGLKLKDELEATYDNEVNHSRLYTNLDTLVTRGLIEKGTIDRRTNSYSLSQKGRAWLEAKAEWANQYTSEATA